LNYQYGWNRTIMKYVGIWPEERKWNRPSSYIVLLPFLSMLCFVSVPQTMNLPRIAHDLDLVVENLSMTNVTVTMSLMKTVAFWMNGKMKNVINKLNTFLQIVGKILRLHETDFQIIFYPSFLFSLLQCIANDWATVDSKIGRETMMDIARMTRKIIIGCSMICQLVLAFYLILRLFFMKYDDNKMFIRGYYPYNTTVSPNYELTMIGQAIAGVYSSAIYSSVDTFIAMLVLHACGQISNLKNELREISHGKTDLQTRLKKIVQKHNYITRFVLKKKLLIKMILFAETVEKSFNMMLLVQMLGCIVQLCFQSFQAITSVGEKNKRYVIFQIAFLCYYVICVLVQLLLYCYVGERLTFESTDITKTAYHCEWYNLPPDIARLLIIIMCRARASPLKLTAGKFCYFTILLYSQ
ncbi:unnamed protein product, partial [Heterotrigona itama]